MNTNWKILLSFILVVIIFCLGRCSKSNEKEIKTVTITTPEISGKSDTIYKPKYLTTTKDSLIYKNSVIYTDAPFNKELADKYNQLSSESAKLKEYLKSISIHEYIVPWEDSLVKIKGTFKTQGELLSTQYEYTLKERKIVAEIPVKKPTIGFLLGSSVENNIKLDKFNLNIKTGIQRKNGDLILGSYGIIDKSIEIGYLIKL